VGVKNVGSWNESELSYPGRSHGHAEMNFKTWSKCGARCVCKTSFYICRGRIS
ncbi:MAG: hypothetical protein ACJAX4_003363, partial [Clostridium sp.]